MEKLPCIKKCGRVHAETLSLCDGTNLIPEGTKEALVAKIPVVLAEKDIQIDIDAEIELKHPYYDIKRIKKDVFLTQCKLILTTGNKNSGKLFIEGYVRKNIEYTTAECIDKDVVSGGLYHTTVDVPFSCVTEVEYTTPPVVCLRKPADEIELICNKGCGCGCGYKCGQEILSALPCEQNFVDNLCYTEKPYCELEQARIYEADIHQRRICDDDYKDEYCEDDYHPFRRINEKMVLYLRLKVLQNQQVNINFRHDDYKDCNKLDL